MSDKEPTAALDVRTFFKRWPKFYYFVMIVFGPILFTGLSSYRFVKKYQLKGTILNLGSGPRIIAKEITNVDIHPYIGVNLVADIMAIPLPDASVSGIISDNMLEHVPNPTIAVKEMHRLLKKDGLAYIAVPFLYPFHASPSDYYRWSKGGLYELFRDFDVIEFGVNGGPFSALTAYLCHFVGFILSCGSDMLYMFFANIAMFIFFPIKFLDFLFARFPNAEHLAASLYIVVRKR
jgi:SAM-dependent methyltransferase